MTNLTKIHLISRIDHLKGDWWLWEADMENPDGSMTHGTAQCDGGGHGPPEAFDPDDETAEEGRKL